VRKNYQKQERKSNRCLPDTACPEATSSDTYGSCASPFPARPHPTSMSACSKESFIYGVSPCTTYARPANLMRSQCPRGRCLHSAELRPSSPHRCPPRLPILRPPSRFLGAGRHYCRCRMLLFGTDYALPCKLVSARRDALSPEISALSKKGIPASCILAVPDESAVSTATVTND
jgi:hypothetical protein